MRPVNLIPPDQRRGASAATRTGALPYVLLGALAVALVAVTALVLTSNQIEDRRAEKAELVVQEAEASARAEALAPYAEFAALSKAREQTVTSLAQSRFDWERVVRELALVLPGDVWLTGLGGSVGGEAQNEATGSTLATQLAGPSLSIKGCAEGHEAVAGLLEALEDIDGVTRVGISSSERPTQSSSAGGDAADCRTRNFISQFEVTVAFDDAAPGAPAPQAVPPASAEGPELADARQAEQQARDSAARQTEKSENAAEIIPGVAK